MATENPWDNVELELEEHEAAVQEAKRKKFFRQQTAGYWDKVNEPVQYPTLTALELGRALTRVQIGTTSDGQSIYFKIDEANREAVKLLCQYFTADPAFEQDGRSLSKGILLQGPVGVGKSMVMELLTENQKQCFKVVGCNEVASEFVNQNVELRKVGINPLAKFFGPIPVAVNHNAYGHRIIGICFDDIGTENTRSMHFGEVKNCMEEVIFTRYKYGNFPLTHGTTNLSWDQLKETYGLRVYDRMREMFNPIAWPVDAKSRRV